MELTAAQFFSTAIAVAYYHQSRDPSYGRSQAPSSAFYRMNPYGQSDPPFQPPPTYGQPYAPYGADGGPPVYAQGDAKLPPQEKNGDGYDMEPGTGDLANRYQENSSEVTLRAADDDDDRDTGRRGEGRV